MATVELRGLRRTFGIRRLDHLDLEVRSGELCPCSGPSGCGKTTAPADHRRLRVGRLARSSSRARTCSESPPTSATWAWSSRPQPVPEHDRAAERRVRAPRPQGEPTRHGRSGPGSSSSWSGSATAMVTGTPVSSRAASSSGWPSPRRSPSSRACCSSTTSVGPRRQGPGAAPRGGPPDTAGARHHDALRHPRPGGGPLDLRSGGRHVPGPCRAARHPAEIYSGPRTAFVANFVGR